MPVGALRLRHQNVGDVLSGYFRSTPPVKMLGESVPVENDPFDIGGDDRLLNGVEQEGQKPKTFLGRGRGNRAQGRGSLLGLGSRPHGSNVGSRGSLVNALRRDAAGAAERQLGHATTVPAALGALSAPVFATDDRGNSARNQRESAPKRPPVMMHDDGILVSRGGFAP